MFKKFLPLFALFLLTTTAAVFFYPQKIFGASDHLLISQIQIAGATASDEFIELYNPTSDPIDMSSFRLTKKVSSGTQSNLIASMSGVINPNSYYLFAHTNYIGSVSADKTYSTSSVTADNTVILYSDSGATVIDKVGFGNPFLGEYEELPFPTNPTANQSIIRLNNFDSNNNSNDFIIQEISTPRNSSYILATSTPNPTTEPTITPSPTSTPVPTPTTTPTSTPIITAIPTITTTLTPSPTPALPVMTSSPTQKPSATPTQKPHNEHIKKHEYHLPFGYKCEFEKHDYKFKKIIFKFYKFHLRRD